jgi:leucyl/phenylalanyl-tRNA--protein transferase
MRALYRENTVVEKIPSEILIGAYMEGVFPMSEGGEIYWFQPKERGIIPLDERFHISHGLKRALRKRPFEVRFDTAFREVMDGCSEREETWIDPVIKESYGALFDEGFAHSVECWDEDGLQGGLYGVRLGRAFFGESMFSRKSDASKIALVKLVEWLREEEAILLDTQWITDHLRTFGGYEVPAEKYREMLAKALDR